MSEIKSQQPQVASRVPELAREFERGARRRVSRVLYALQTMDTRDCRRSAAWVDEELQRLAAEAYFFGLMRTHRLAREARGALRFRACEVYSEGELAAAAAAACEIVLQVWHGIRPELAALQAAGGKQAGAPVAVAEVCCPVRRSGQGSDSDL